MRRLVLWIEFALIYGAAPLALAIYLKRLNLFASIGAMTLAGLVLLARTPGFSAREFVDFSGFWRRIPLIIGYTAIAAAFIAGLTLWLAPERWMIMPRQNPQFLAIIWMFYPWLSVFGQEAIYRPLFFHRYGGLFPNETARVWINAALFSFAHLLFQNPVAMSVTFVAGLVFARVYARTKSFPLVFVLHWIGGGLVFTIGLGRFFFHGAV